MTQMPIKDEISYSSSDYQKEIIQKRERRERIPENPQIVENSLDNKKFATLTVDNLLNLLDDYLKNIEKQPPKEFIVTQISIQGNNEKSKESAYFKAAFEVHILKESNWTEVELLSTSNSILSTSIETIEENITQPEKKTKTKKDETTYEAYIIPIRDHYTFLASNKGIYKIEIEFTVPYVESSVKELGISLPLGVKNNLSFKIYDSSVNVKLQPSLGLETISYPKQGITHVKSSFAPTKMLIIQWTPQTHIEEVNEVEKVKLNVVANHEILHSTGEGLIKTNCLIDYDIEGGSCTEFTVLINSYEKQFRILSVDGKGILNWEISSNKSQHTLKVYLNYGFEKDYILNIDSELEMGGTSGKVYVPSFSCVDSFISREKGKIGIFTRTNVEVKEESRKYLRKIDVTELPQQMHEKIEQKILHAYEFLERGNSLILNVTRHEDVEILSCVIDDCNYQITQTETQLVHNITLIIRNTSKQYLRIIIPKESMIWTCLLDNIKQKPSRDHSDLLISIPKDKETLKLTLLLSSPSKMKNGKIQFEICKFDCPINKFFLTTYLPISTDYGEFEGNLKEIPFFSASTKAINNLTGFNNGKPFYFEKFILSEKEDLKLSVDYKEITKGFFSKRRILC